MSVYKPSAGENIDRAAKALIERAPCEMEFNGVTIVARRGMSAEDIVRSYWAAMDAEDEAYRASPKYAEDQKRNRDDIAARQAVVDALYAELPSLDWTDAAAVMDWCARLADPADRIGVTVPPGVYAKFRAHGYRDGQNVGEGFDENDRDNYARYIIGQALAGILSGHGPHPMTATFAEQWRKRFLAS